MRLYLTRHPRPRIAEGICYGASDVPVEEGVATCAAALRACLPGTLRLFSSPSLRCRVLAEALSPEAWFDERLRERNFGDWELKPWHRIPRAQVEAWASDPLGFAPPNGEPASALRRRVDEFLAERDWPNGGDVVIVTHQGVMRMIVARVCRLDAALASRFDFGAAYLVSSAPDAAGRHVSRLSPGAVVI